ncbi:MAG: hypothetical protein K2I42_05745 [Anaeroplasmataceae bacterium]|nr:hypothetical protein [Anaeroplasmataceae bacterium]
MTQFLKKHAKLFYLIFGIFGFAFIILACFYITPYNNTAVNYNSEVLSGEIQSIQKGNEYLALFSIDTDYKFSELYQIMFKFNRSVQTANNMILYLGVVSLVMLAIMFICANVSRKKYYISNLVSGVVCPAITIIFAIVTLIFNFLPLSSLSKNYDALNWGALGNQITYQTAIDLWKANDTSQFMLSSLPLIVYGIVIIIFILVTGMLLAYNVFRYMLTKKELSEKVVDQNA